MFGMGCIQTEEWERSSGAKPRSLDSLRALGSHRRCSKQGRSRVASGAVQRQTGMGRLRTGRRLEGCTRLVGEEGTAERGQGDCSGNCQAGGVAKDGARDLAYDWVDGGVTPDMDPRGGGRVGSG